MNTITIDNNTYNSIVRYAQQNNVLKICQKTTEKNIMTR